MLSTLPPQFIIYSADKTPLSPHTGLACNPHDPAQWADKQTAELAAIHYQAAGIGLVITADSNLFFLDIDHCLQPDGQWSPIAIQLCEYLAGAYIEVSRSGEGLHILGHGVAPEHGTRCPAFKLELYSRGRYIALTGTGAYGDPSFPAQAQLDWMVANYFPPSGPAANQAEWTAEPDPSYTGKWDDDELIHRMLTSTSRSGAFSGKATPAQLWNANIDALAAAYPPQSDSNAFDHSSADAALCQHLAFWTGRNCERIDRLFRLSALFRDKWERQGYMQSTVTGAVAHCRAVYTHAAPADRQPVRESEATPTPVGCTGLRDGMQLLSIPAQIDHFKGCVYIRSLHKAFVPDGELLKPEQFKASYGGYTFSLDMINDKTSRSAWEALTENMGYNFPQAHEACFRPELEPGVIIQEEGRPVVNTYVPVTTETLPGDPSPFLDHLAKMLPDSGDCSILLAYMAAITQYPGVKFQWWPLLQGMEGNGKSMVIRCLSFCVGARYSHTPNAKDIDNKFNSWLRNKLFIGVEEIYTADRQDKIDALKPIITNDRIEIQGKGDNQVTADNRANGVMCSNHKDAVRKTLGDRRNCVFYTAQQEPGDLERDGMGGDYFPDLYDWLKADGYAIVNGYLRSYAIPDAVNPATHCHRAPTTSSTAEAIRSSMGGIEQEVVEAIEEGRPGFAGGWISSAAFDRLLDERRAGGKIPRSKRRDLLRGLGYDWHLGLLDGRVNNAIVDCGVAGRPRLYIRNGHPLAVLQSAAEVIRCYQEAQANGGVVVTLAGLAFSGRLV
jgi:hypothetical protein